MMKLRTPIIYQKPPVDGRSFPRQSEMGPGLIRCRAILGHGTSSSVGAPEGTVINISIMGRRRRCHRHTRRHYQDAISAADVGEARPAPFWNIQP